MKRTVVPVPGAGNDEAYLWMRPQRPPRGPQPPLTRDQIAAAAVRVADELGADGVSMRRVAAELGSGTMSLYRHVRSKDELLDAMIDAVAAEDGPPPAVPSGDWREDLATMARRIRGTILRHPWLALALPRRPSLGPNMLAQMEFALAAVDGLGLAMNEMVGMIRTIDAFVRGYTQTELAERQWRRPQAGIADDDWQRGVLPYVTNLVQSGRYPYFTRMITEADEFPDPDATFEWQLQLVLSGLAEGVSATPTGDRERANLQNHFGR